MVEKRKKVTVIVEKTGTGFSAYVKEIDGLTTVGKSLSELKANFIEVLESHVDYLHEMGDTTIKVENIDINYKLDLKQLFEYLAVINKSAFAERYVEMNPSLFRQYTSGHASFSDEKVRNISKGLHKLADELSDLTLV